MPSARSREILVGDVGTVYGVPICDDDIQMTTFDPSAAPTRQLRFRMPGASGLCVRSAVAVERTINGASVWCLEYTVLAVDVGAYVDESVGGFHLQPGSIKIEAHLEFSAAQKWTSSTVQRDYQRRPLKIVAPLSA